MVMDNTINLMTHILQGWLVAISVTDCLFKELQRY